MKFNRKRLLIGGGLLSLFAAALLFWDQFSQEEIELRLRYEDPAVVNKGREIYAANCADCHGVDLAGQANWRVRKDNDKLPAPPHDATGHTWHHSDALLIDLTKHGLKPIAGADYETDMPAYGELLSDDEIIAVLSYIKSTWPEEIQKRHDTIR